LYMRGHVFMHLIRTNDLVRLKFSWSWARILKRSSGISTVFLTSPLCKSLPSWTMSRWRVCYWNTAPTWSKTTNTKHATSAILDTVPFLLRDRP
jgi:hypothetical protein